MIDRAADLWDAIVEGAGLDLELYDRDLLLELACKLGVDADDFAGELERAGVAAQTLLQAIAHLVAPYAEMMTDVLSFFARAGARSSSDNLRIQFDFGAAGDNFEFDLRNFRDWESRFRDVLGRITIDEIDDFMALQLRHSFVVQGITYDVVGSKWIDRDVVDEDVAKWLTSRELTPLPQPPAVTDADLRSFLARVWAIMHRAALSEAANSVLSHEDIRSIIRGAYLLSESEAQLLQRLRSLFEEIPAKQVETRTLLEQLLEVFNLPIWKRRSEFYSIWVGARLMTVLGDATCVHVVDRTLVFAFAGSHLATTRLSNGENRHVWCELRTEATAGVVGKGRKKRIQPDYVVLREPTSHPDSGSLIVECKQYLKQSRREFANALIDYANNHKNAVIALVNYGPTSPSVLAEIKAQQAAILPRSRLIGMLRPRSAAALHEFEEVIRSILPQTEEVSILSRGPEECAVSQETAITRGKLRLRWSTGADLDLHCWVTDATGNHQHVDYSQLKANLGGSRVELDRDVRSGGEAETLTWESIGDIRLDFGVFLFSPESDIVSSTNATVEVYLSDGPWTLHPPGGQRGRWWRLFRIESDGSIRIWNSIGDNAVTE